MRSSCSNAYPKYSASLVLKGNLLFVCGYYVNTDSAAAAGTTTTAAAAATTTT